MIVSGLGGDHGGLAAQLAAMELSHVQGARHSKQQMVAVLVQDQILKPKPATKLHAQVWR